jgi:hypothetical protein
MSFYKNKAQKLIIYATDASGSPKTGDAANITSQITLDAGSSSPTNQTHPTEIDATNQKGLYVYNLLAAETNANAIAVSSTSTTLGVSIDPIIIYTDDIWNITDLIESGLTPAQALRLISAAVLGTLAGANGNTVTINGAGVNTPRIVANVDTFGNRNSVTLTKGT